MLLPATAFVVGFVVVAAAFLIVGFSSGMHYQRRLRLR